MVDLFTSAQSLLVNLTPGRDLKDNTLVCVIPFLEDLLLSCTPECDFFQLWVP